MALALGIPLFWADAAAACSCVPIDAREQLKESDGAFVGRLVAVREVDPPAEGEPTSSADPGCTAAGGFVCGASATTPPAAFLTGWAS